MARPYRILGKVGHSYRLDLLDTIRVHPVFSLDKLRKAATNLLLGQKTELPLLIRVSGNDEWEVEEVLASKLVRKTLMY